MRYNNYKFKFYINAKHSIIINGKQGEIHTHTWEIMINTVKAVTDFVLFDNVEGKVDELLSVYQDKYINEIAPFDTINPTLENICEYFKDEILKLLYNLGWVLISIEISETPTRSYVIDLIDEIKFEDINSKIADSTEKNIEKLVENKIVELIKNT